MALDLLLLEKSFVEETATTAIRFYSWEGLWLSVGHNQIDLPENYRTARRKLREDYNPQIQQVNQDILNLKTEISDLEIQLVETGVDVGPAIYLAKSFNTDVDSVVKFFIFILIFVFDPLALSMVLAWNISLREKEFEVYGEVDKIFEKYKKKKEPKIEEPKVEKRIGRDARK